MALSLDSTQSPEASQFSGLHKQRRVTRACDFCHQRAIKCRQGPEGSSNLSSIKACATCVEHSVPCTRFRRERKRGKKPGKTGRPLLSFLENNLHTEWKIEESRHGSREVIKQLVDVYFDTVYPIVPIFDQPEYMAQWQCELLPYDQGSYACIMAMCALSAQHVVDQAVFTLALAPPVSTIKPNVYLTEAVRAIPADLDQCRSLDYLRAISILVLVGISRGDNGLMHKYMGLYHALLAQDGLQDENHWPAGITDSETEIRRRLYWAMYRFEVHTALVMGHLIRVQESQSAVLYPKQHDDDGTDEVSKLTATGEWLSGWNKITDLYRILEYAINNFRAKRIIVGGAKSLMAVHSSDISILEQVEALQLSLPLRFRQVVHLHGGIRQSRCGFQVANIVVTVQLVKMIIFASESTTVRKACQVALELIEEVSAIPLEYFRAIGPPMLQELSGIGHILSSVIGRPLSEAEYQQLRNVMLRMAGFLISLESCISSAGTAGARLRQHVNRIDDHVAGQQSWRAQKERETISQGNDINNTVSVESFFTVPPDLFDNMLWNINLPDFNANETL